MGAALNLSKHLLIQQAHARTAQTVCKTLCRVVCWQLTITEDAELLDGNDFVKGYCSSSLRLAQSMWGFFLLIEFSTLTCPSQFPDRLEEPPWVSVAVLGSKPMQGRALAIVQRQAVLA